MMEMTLQQKKENFNPSMQFLPSDFCKVVKQHLIDSLQVGRFALFLAVLTPHQVQFSLCTIPANQTKNALVLQFHIQPFFCRFSSCTIASEATPATPATWRESNIIITWLIQLVKCRCKGKTPRICGLYKPNKLKYTTFVTFLFLSERLPKRCQ